MAGLRLSRNGTRLCFNETSEAPVSHLQETDFSGLPPLGPQRTGGPRNSRILDRHARQSTAGGQPFGGRSKLSAITAATPLWFRGRPGRATFVLSPSAMTEGRRGERRHSNWIDTAWR